MILGGPSDVDVVAAAQNQQAHHVLHPNCTEFPCSFVQNIANENSNFQTYFNRRSRLSVLDTKMKTQRNNSRACHRNPPTNPSGKTPNAKVPQQKRSKSRKFQEGKAEMRFKLAVFKFGRDPSTWMCQFANLKVYDLVICF